MSRKGVALLFLMILSLVVLSASGSANAQGKSIVLINLNEEIDPGSAHMIVNAMSSLNKANIAAVVIVMNTPGGILQNMLQMITAINQTEASGIPVYTYILPDGMGASAGSYVAMATDYIFMGPGSFIGPSTPIVVGGTSIEQQHVTGAMQSLMVSLAYAHGRNTTAASIMVTDNYAYPAANASSVGLVNGLYNTLQSFLVHENLSQYNQIEVNPSLYDNFLSFISNTFVEGLLILIGAIAIMFDFYHGSIVLSVVGIAMIALGLLGAQVVGASAVGIALLIAAAVLILAEIKLGHGASMIVGVVVGVVGTFLLASPYSASNPGYSPSPFGASEIVAAVLVVALSIVLALYLRKIISSIREKKYTGAEALISKTGTVSKDLDPTGWISIEGVQWKATSSTGEKIKKDEEVEVIDRDGLTLVVRRKE